ncbi:PAS domain S-box protein [Halorubrum trueperi]|uniref:histidine kinase n=1 Tax=Halorubrum trueperi TaxID=2004704 RepID=A0ABD5UJM7_9EURY
MDEIRVLHVDDEPDFSDLTATFLEREDDRFVVETATSSADGLSALADGSFDCVISDYDMPSRTGIEFLRDVRAERPDLPFVLFTGKGSEEIASDAIRAGATDYLQKGIGTEQYELLANRIRNAVSQYRSHRAEQRLVEVAAHTDQLISVFSSDWSEVLFVSSAYERLWGRSVEALREDPTDFLSGVHPEDRRAVRDGMARLSAGEPIEIECRVNAAEDHRRWVRIHGDPIRDGSGAVARVACVGADITEEKRSRRRRERQRETLLELATDEAVVNGEFDAAIRQITETTAEVLDVDRVNVWLSETAGVTPSSTADGAALVCVDNYDRRTGDHDGGMRLRTGEHPTYVEALETNRAIAVDDAADDPRTAELADEYLDAKGIGALLDGTLRSEGDVVGMICHEHVGGPREWTDDEIEFVSDVADVVHRAVRNHERAARERELRRYETIVQSLADAVYTLDQGGNIDFVNDRYVEMKGASREELLGTPIDRLVSDSVMERTRSMYEALDRGELDVARIEYDFRTIDGEEIPSELRFTPLPGSEGSVARVGVIRDVTERKRRERELERQNERLEEFASVVSHDLRNPLHVAEGNLDLAREEYDSDRLDAAANALDRMGVLIDDLLALAREGESVDETEPIDLDEVADACWRNVDTGGAVLTVETDVTIRADESRLRQLLENLFRNCVEHGGDVAVTIGELDGSTGFFVEDDGDGIPADEREAIFESGYSTAAGGTGFGLTIAEEIADAHGWTIRATDGSAGGARFELTGVTFP